MFEKTDETLGTHACSIHLQLLQYMLHPWSTFVISRSTFVTSVWNTCNIPLKQLKTFELYTCNMHRIPVGPSPSSASGRRRVATVARGEAGGLPRKGPTLLLALAAPVDIVSVTAPNGPSGPNSRYGPLYCSARGRATGWYCRQEHYTSRLRVLQGSNTVVYTL
jgi:hypothetical protein